MGLVSLLMVLELRPAEAVPPVNDICTGAELIPPSGPFPYYTAATDVSEATSLGDPVASCSFGNSFSHSVWYIFTPDTTAFYTLSSCAEAPTATTIPDTLMAIFTSTGGCHEATNELPTSASTLGCADDSCGPGFTQAAIRSELMAGTTYYVVVWQNDLVPPPAGNAVVQLRISKTSPPSNDQASQATELSLNLPILGTTVLAQNDYELAAADPCFSGTGQKASTAAGRDVVYSFTAPVACNYSIKVDHYNNMANYDLVVYAADSFPAGPPPATVTNCLAAANRNAATEAEEILCYPLEANQKIFIFVDEDTFSPGGSAFTIEVTQCTRENEPNNSWTNATVLAFGIEGSIQPADVDYYSVGSPPEGSRLFAMLDGSAANATLFEMRVMSVSATATNTLEYDTGNNDALFGESSPNLAGTPLTGTPTFLRINSPQAPVEPYRLYAVVQPPMAAATAEVEPNDTPAQANMAGNNYFRGSLAGPAPSIDVDVYSFSVAANDLVFLSLDGDPQRTNAPINAKLELLDSSGNVVVTVDDAAGTSSTNTHSGLANVPFSPGEALIFRSVASGTYYARVSISPNANLQNGAGDYLLSISRNGFAGSCGCNTPPALTGTSVTSPINENDIASVTGTIIDPDAVQPHDLTIDWGDGSSTTTNLKPAVISFSVAHRYLDDNSPATGSRIYPIGLSISDNAGGNSSSGLAVTVNNVAPSLTNVAITSPIPLNSTATLSGNFTDPGTLDTFALTINWGDGSGSQTMTLPAGATSFNASHQYTSPGSNITVSVQLQDNDTASVSTNLTLTVGSQPAGPRLKLVTPWMDGHVLLQLQGAPGTTYRIETSAALTSWTDFMTRTADANGFFQIEDTNSPSPLRRFYRAVSQ